MKMYKKPIVTVDAGLAEGVYAASGAKGTQTMHLYRLLGQERQRHLHSQVQQVIH